MHKEVGTEGRYKDKEGTVTTKDDSGMEDGIEMEYTALTEEGEEVSLLELGATRMMTQEVDPGDRIIVYSHNMYNRIIRLAMIWNLVQLWLEGAQF